MKKVIISIIIILTFAFAACTPTKPEPQASDSVALVFISGEIGFSATISGPWVYANPNGDQVFFSLNNDTKKDSMISISSEKYNGDPMDLMIATWEVMRKNIGQDEVAPTAIVVGNYAGLCYDFLLETEPKTYCKFMYWASHNRIYICTVTVTEQYAKEFEIGLNSLFETFEVV